ncbi:MAG: tRNA-dihydrouridine synthase family protein [Clostridia bacterium]|nr:tRNA-dihydrouridine synthase family protein [Clostridia bacterium]
MQYTFAPMEGITNHLYRNAHRDCFTPADRYFIPFVSAKGKGFTGREKRDIDPANNQGLNVVPQVMSNDADSFMWVANELIARGYEEINLNLGCPSSTVISKGKGAGFLGRPEALETFLSEIFDRCPVRISIKTRLGMKDPAEFERILAIYNRFPVSELIVHPRIREDLYREPVRPEWFAFAKEHTNFVLCYNGDLYTAEDVRAFEAAHPDVERVMMGRGFLMRPGMVGQLRGQEPTVDQLRRFHERMYAAYRDLLGTEAFVMMKMKELWAYLGVGYDIGAKLLKKIRKCDRYREYDAAMAAVFAELESRE